jgi:hypothetical protein
VCGAAPSGRDSSNGYEAIAIAQHLELCPKNGEHQLAHVSAVHWIFGERTHPQSDLVGACVAIRQSCLGERVGADFLERAFGVQARALRATL